MIEFDPNSVDDVLELLCKLNACRSGLTWFEHECRTPRESTAPDFVFANPAEIWAETDRAPFMIWLVEQLLPAENQWETPGAFAVRLMELCREVVPWFRENPVAFGSEIDWDGLPDGPPLLVLYSFTNGTLYDLPNDVMDGTGPTEGDIRQKFAELVRGMYPYEKVGELMVKWWLENT